MCGRKANRISFSRMVRYWEGRQQKVAQSVAGFRSRLREFPRNGVRPLFTAGNATNHNFNARSRAFSMFGCSHQFVDTPSQINHIDQIANKTEPSESNQEPSPPRPRIFGHNSTDESDCTSHDQSENRKRNKRSARLPIVLLHFAQIFGR